MPVINQQANQNNKPVSAHRLLAVPALMLGTALVLTACGGNEHEVKAVDKVEEAAELARANAPEPQPLELDDVETVAPATEEEATAEAEDSEAVVEDDAVAEDAEQDETSEAESAAVEEAPEVEAELEETETVVE